MLATMRFTAMRPPTLRSGRPHLSTVFEGPQTGEDARLRGDTHKGSAFARLGPAGLSPLNEIRNTCSCPPNCQVLPLCQASNGKALRDAAPRGTLLAHARFVIETQPRPPACLAHRGRDQRRSGGGAVRRVLRAVGRSGRANRTGFSLHRGAASAAAGVLAHVE